MQRKVMPQHTGKDTLADLVAYEADKPSSSSYQGIYGIYRGVSSVTVILKYWNSLSNGDALFGSSPV